MAGTIVISTNLKHLRYSVTRLAGAESTPIVVSCPLVGGKATVRVDTDGLYQVTFIDADHVYGLGQYFEQVTIAGDNVVTVKKNWYDADGNDLEPSRPVETIAPPSDPKPPEPPETPSQPEEPAFQPSEGGYLLDLISRLVKAILRLFKRT